MEQGLRHRTSSGPNIHVHVQQHALRQGAQVQVHVDAAHSSPPALAPRGSSAAPPGEPHELDDQAMHVNSLMARHGGRFQSTEITADIEDSGGWLCEAIIALAGMLFAAWALGYLWWHVDQLLDDDNISDDAGKHNTEPWYFAWVS